MWTESRKRVLKNKKQCSDHWRGNMATKAYFYFLLVKRVSLRSEVQPQFPNPEDVPFRALWGSFTGKRKAFIVIYIFYFHVSVIFQDYRLVKPWLCEVGEKGEEYLNLIAAPQKRNTFFIFLFQKFYWVNSWMCRKLLIREEHESATPDKRCLGTHCFRLEDRKKNKLIFFFPNFQGQMKLNVLKIKFKTVSCNTTKRSFILPPFSFLKTFLQFLFISVSLLSWVFFLFLSFFFFFF